MNPVIKLFESYSDKDLISLGKVGLDMLCYLLTLDIEIQNQQIKN